MATWALFWGILWFFIFGWLFFVLVFFWESGGGDEGFLFVCFFNLL